MKCCAVCFGDRGLRKEISFRSTEVGTCSYCGTQNEKLIDPKLLSDKFALVTGVYEPAEEGKTLAQWLREDWGLFGHPKMDDANAKALLADIFDDGEIVRKLFVPSAKYARNRVGQWEELRKELMHENRFFPNVQIDLDRLGLLLSRLLLEEGEVGTTWYRARIQQGAAAFNPDEMSAPPPNLASHGRANPAGIPYLYLGSESQAALSEVRPHTGETVCVAEFSTPPDLKLVDLRNPRATVSPFLLADEDDVGQMRDDVVFLQRLGEELTRPVLPLAAAFDYTPSQYLCEFIKKCGYDGVIYNSSVSTGVNLALFKPDKAVVGAVQQCRVKVLVELDASGQR